MEEKELREMERLVRKVKEGSSQAKRIKGRERCKEKKGGKDKRRERETRGVLEGRKVGI